MVEGNPGGQVKERHLYVPEGISMEAQRAKAEVLVRVNDDLKVVVHAHGTNESRCSDGCTVTVLDQRGDSLGPESGSE